jgi:predicted helicase
MQINEYLKLIKNKFSTGISTEHSYRADLQNLLNEMVKGITITNEPKRQKCGAPDYIIQKKEVPLGYIEAKDIGTDLNKTEKSDQMKRYLSSLDNLILTDYLEFRFYNYGQKVKEIKIASIENGKIKALTDFFDSFSTHILDFCEFKGQTIKSAQKLAKMMAQKARMMKEVLFNAVKEEDDNNTLQDQLKAFRQILIHDLDEKTFSDIYAQTITYGLFAARLHDETLEDFSRQEARDLIPKSNPFLRNLFDYISGAQLDDRVIWIVDDLADILRAADLKSILADFGKTTGQNDPFLHFYETFLAEYDPKLRKSRGVYYTPEPVVNFIVRAVDDILEKEFDLPQGLADISKVKIKKIVEGAVVSKGKKKGTDIFEEVEVHKVQILDPATGTGTFLSETIKQIYQKFKGQEGLWSSYVEDHLIPRINGFEILMASYTMCHLKIEMLLRQTGYKPKDEKNQKRLKVFLTNSLEEAHSNTGTLFANWLSKEATEANHVKRDAPVMVVIGNPPYANFGQMNQGEWIHSLIADYKKNLNEKKINLDDDYIKFIRYGQYFIEKNGEGILAYISNNSFIDGVTHRQMRKHLLKTFDKIYILNLHGSAMKNEVAPDGSKDENVFDIQQGVSINLFIKTNKKEKMSKVFYADFYGIRYEKYESLLRNSIKTVSWKKLDYREPYYFFVPKDFSLYDFYQKYFSINELFQKVNNGIKTDRDSLFIDFDKNILSKRMQTLLSGNIPSSFISKYRVTNSGSYKITQKIRGLKYGSKYISPIQYRPFDYRFTYYDPKIISRPAQKVMPSILKGSIALLSCRQQSTFDFQHVLVTNTLSEVCTVSLQTKETTYVFPLYTYLDSSEQITIDNNNSRFPNLNFEIVNKIAENLKLKFTFEKIENKNTFAPIDIFDYIYAILHSPLFREKYKEFLKIDFPRIPYPENKVTFWHLVKLGGELRTIHLLDNPIVEKYITSYPISGSNIVEKPEYKGEKVFINKKQYFDNVPEIAWNFYIGSYRPAQKWMKDRKGKDLSVEDIFHYQKIIVALTETDRIMREIDKYKLY